MESINSVVSKSYSSKQANDTTNEQNKNEPTRDIRFFIKMPLTIFSRLLSVLDQLDGGLARAFIDILDIMRPQMLSARVRSGSAKPRRSFDHGGRVQKSYRLMSSLHEQRNSLRPYHHDQNAPSQLKLAHQKITELERICAGLRKENTTVQSKREDMYAQIQRLESMLDRSEQQRIELQQENSELKDIVGENQASSL